MGIQTLVSTCINQKINGTERNLFVLHSQKRHLSLPSPNIIGDHFKTITRSIFSKVLNHYYRMKILPAHHPNRSMMASVTGLDQLACRSH